MKSFYLFIIFSLLFSAQNVFASVVESPSDSCIITTLLRMGSRGSEVKCLQKKVDATADGIFGPLTKASVVIWQSKQGLLSDGIVGPLTRAVFNHLAVNKNSVVVPIAPDITAPTSPTPPVSSIVIPGTDLTFDGAKPESLNNKQQSLEKYVALVKKGLIERGESPETISFIEETLRENAAKNPNSLQQFFDTQKEIYKRKISETISKTPKLAFLKKAVSAIDSIFSTKKASARVDAPFGGFIVFVDPVICTCDPIVGQLFVELPSAPPGISNMILNYVEGAQLFEYYNLPYPLSIGSVGFYVPGLLSCLIRVHKVCIPLPAAGQITPVVGTSLLPAL